MKIIYIIIVFCSLSIASNATVYWDETFNYTAGDINGQGSWTTAGTYTSGTGYTIGSSTLSYTVSSLAYTLSGSGKTLVNNIGATAADYKAYKPFNSGNSVNSGVIYLSFLFKANSNISSTNQELFGLADGTSAGPKVLIGKTTTGFFKIGTVRGSTSSLDYKYAATPTSMTVGTTYLIVLKYDFSTSTSSVYINPTLDGTEPLSPEISDASSGTTRTKLSNLWVRATGTVVTTSTVGGARVSTTWSEAVASTAYVPPISTNLPAPTVGSATNIAASGFTAGWTPVDNAVGYTVKVYWGTTFVDSTNVNGQSTSSAVVSKLVPSLTYTYKVIAQGDGSNYTNSALSTASTAFSLSSATIPTNNKLKIILKLDDLGVNASAGFAASPVYDFLKANNIKANMGAIANRCDNTAGTTLSPYLNATNQLGDTLFEVWNHGYDHVSPEFSGTTYDYQKTHFENATNQIKSLLGVQMHSFGTPYNASDAVTNTVIGENPNYKVMMFSDIVSATNGVFYMNNRVNMESATANPVYNYFVANYNSYKSTYLDYMVLQGHPNTYSQNPATFDQLKLIVQFLVSEGVEFVRCFDYYRSLSLAAPTNLSSGSMNSNQINLSWTDNSSNEINFRVERSTDGTNWTLAGTASQNATSFTDSTVPGQGNYYYRVYANCGMKSDYSNVIQVSNVGTALSNTLNNSTFSVFQSLTENEIIISGKKADSDFIQCDLYNSSGQLIQNLFSGNVSAGNFQITKKLTNMNSGIYFCRVLCQNEQTIKKIILSK